MLPMRAHSKCLGRLETCLCVTPLVGCGVVDADHDVPVSGMDEVRPRFEFDDEVADASLLDRPSHIRDHSNPQRSGAAQEFVEEAEHRVLVEAPPATIGL
jgi:hypothetical protein